MMARVFTKRHGPAVAEDSVRLRILDDVCDQVDGVVAPDVLHVDEARGCIDYQYMDLSVPFAACLGDQEVAQELGQVLAAMHAVRPRDLGELSLDPLPLPLIGIIGRDAELLTEALPPGWFHSDFWHGNVFVLANGELAVIDPLPPRFLLPGQYVLASGAADVVTMYMSLVARHPLVRQLTLPLRPRLDSAEAFLDAYLIARGVRHGEVAETIRRSALAFAQIWMEKSVNRLSWPVYKMKRAALARVMRELNTRGREWK
jgi:hypothetical protein